MKNFLISLLMLLLPTMALAQTETKNTVPGANVSFLSNLQNFLEQEDAERFQDMFSGFVVSGCTHGTVAGLTGTPASCTAYPGGFYTTETASITYPDDDTCWVIMDSVTTGDSSPFNRVSGTNYLTDCTSATEPTLPANSVWMMKVTTASGSVSAVIDMRDRIVNTDETVTASFTTDVGSLWIFTENGQLSPSTGVVVTLNGPMPEAPLKKRFNCVGSEACVVNLREAHPEWFGALRDGSEDDGPEIDTAHDSIHSDGGDIVFTSGVYAVKTEVDADKSNVRFILPPSTTIDLTGITGTGTASVHNTVNVLSAFKVTASDVTFLGGRFTGPASSDTPSKNVVGILLASGANKFTIRDTYFTLMYQGLWPGGGITDLTVENVELDNMSHGIQVGYHEGVASDPQVTVAQFINLNSHDHTNDGLKLAAYADKITILGGHYHDNDKDGIDTFVAGEFLDIIGVKSFNNTTHGLNIKVDDGTFTPATGGHSRRVTVIGGQFHDNTLDGISAGSGSRNASNEPWLENLTIIGSQAYSNGQRGFDLSHLKWANITGTQAIENDERGYNIQGCQDSTFNGIIAIKNNQTAQTEGINLAIGAGTEAVENTRCRFIGGVSEGEGGASKQQNGWSISNNSCLNCLFSGNSSVNNNTKNWNVGIGLTDTIFRDNEGYITENSGTGTILSGQTSLAVAHGLGNTPNAQDIYVNFTESPTNDPGNFWLTSVGATNFTLNVRSDPGASNLDFVWRAISNGS